MSYARKEPPMLRWRVQSGPFLWSLLQKSSVEVNEECTRAASGLPSVTKSNFERLRSKVDFVADHPFLFLVREDITGLVVLVGVVLDPTDGIEVEIRGAHRPHGQKKVDQFGYVSGEE
ncbi:hypothetical protein Dimus_009955 [Dionaea muscipula]